LVFIAIKSDVGRAILAGGTIGAEIPVAAGPLKPEELPDAGSSLCWFFSAGDLCAAIIARCWRAF
jgi:hypothetical protein